MKVGDKVIALSDSPDDSCQFRMKGSVYMVNSITYCVMCMKTLINIGQRSQHNGVVCKCGMLMDTGGFMWTPKDEFVLLEDKQNAIDKAVKEEDYEFAAKLRDL
jgi:protein-arginine kinase activator protein McsA